MRPVIFNLNHREAAHVMAALQVQAGAQRATRSDTEVAETLALRNRLASAMGAALIHPARPLTLVDLYDGGDNIIAASVPLEDCFPDDRPGQIRAAIEIALSGIHTTGGGAAPVHVLRSAGA